MATFSIWKALTVFAVYFVIDILYAKYILAVGRNQALAAAGLSALIYSLISFGVLSYSENHLYVIPLAFGAASGTYWTVKREKKADG